MKKKRVLIAGGAGFLGSHLCDRMIQVGNEVLCVDNFFTGTKENILHLLDHPSFELIRCDICDPFNIEVDEIYNFACPASPSHYQADPVQTLKTNVYGTMNMLDLARKGKRKIIQASTSEVYGDPHVHPQTETYWGHVNPIGFRSCYDEGKRTAETLCLDYFRQYQIPVKVARIFNTYGPRMHPNDGRVVSNFIVQSLRNQPLAIYGSGRQTRSFCFVDDLIDGVILMMNSSSSVTGPINLGNPAEFRIIDLAKKILKLTGSRSEMIFKNLPSDDPKQRKPDIHRAKTTLGWEPVTDLEGGLLCTIEYFESVLSSQTYSREESVS